MSIPKDEQIVAILQAKEAELAAKYGISGPDEIAWTVSKEEVKEYIAKNGFSSGWVHFQEQTYDGVYLLEDRSKWRLFYKERGEIYYEELFQSREEAMDFLLDEYYLKRKQIA